MCLLYTQCSAAASKVLPEIAGGVLWPKKGFSQSVFRERRGKKIDPGKCIQTSPHFTVTTTKKEVQGLFESGAEFCFRLSVTVSLFCGGIIPAPLVRPFTQKCICGLRDYCVKKIMVVAKGLGMEVLSELVWY